MQRLLIVVTTLGNAANVHHSRWKSTYGNPNVEQLTKDGSVYTQCGVYISRVPSFGPSPKILEQWLQQRVT